MTPKKLTDPDKEHVFFYDSHKTREIKLFLNFFAYPDPDPKRWSTGGGVVAGGVTGAGSNEGLLILFFRVMVGIEIFFATEC